MPQNLDGPDDPQKTSSGPSKPKASTLLVEH
jgi:hypothetical protein